MVYKYNNAIERTVGEELTIKDLFTGNNMPIDLVISKLNGFHGSFINQKCTKHYFMLEGKAKITINDDVFDLEKGDLAVVPVNAKHSIEGKAEFALICTPSYDPDYEQVIKTL